MRIHLRDGNTPYPLFTMKGRLKLSGLGDQAISEMVNTSLVEKFKTEDELQNHVRDSLESFNSHISTNFETLTKYEKIRGEHLEVPAIAVILEGASATGKSLIAIELIQNLTATRFISTDSVRQVLRGIMSQDEHPELFCHTYQAHSYRQAGPKHLNSVLRGYLAQCELITPTIKSMMKEIIVEGAKAVVEGVHIQPGTIQNLSPGVIEVLINPDGKTHKAMFAGKYDLEKLRTVSKDMSVRDSEFQATRAIQEFMISLSDKNDVSILALTDYESAQKAISSLILSRIAELIRSFEEGVSKK